METGGFYGYIGFGFWAIGDEIGNTTGIHSSMPHQPSIRLARKFPDILQMMGEPIPFAQSAVEHNSQHALNVYQHCSVISLMEQ